MIRARGRLRAKLTGRGTGYLPDPDDNRDVLIAAADLPSALPVEVRPVHGIPPLYQEGNSCTGRVVQAFRIGEINQGRQCPELSGLFNYWASRFRVGIHTSDRGSYVREAIKALVRHGSPPASEWPESFWNVQAMPPLRASLRAFRVRGLRGYYRIPTGDVDSMRRVIAAGFCVFGGWRIDDAFLTGKGPELIGVPVGPAQSLGHAWLLDGYDRFGNFHMQNSWRGWRGNSFGESRARITEEFAAQGYDLWSIVTESSVWR